MNIWMLVAREIDHLSDVKVQETTWWCVSRKCSIGDHAFLYKPLSGIVLYFEVVSKMQPKEYCRSFSMDTAKIKILRVFSSPIPAKKIKTILGADRESFVSRNFQGKSFQIQNEAFAQAILKLSK